MSVDHPHVLCEENSKLLCPFFFLFFANCGCCPFVEGIGPNPSVLGGYSCLVSSPVCFVADFIFYILNYSHLSDVCSMKIFPIQLYIFIYI